MSDDGTSSVQFGIFEVDLRSGELRRKGLRVKLQEQPFRVLTLLLEHPGQVVTREELQKKLWPSDTFVDFDHSLNAAIRRLRDALGDSAENPRFVETVARRGYRFLAPLNGVALSVAPPVPQRSANSKRWAMFVMLAMLIVGMAVVWVVGHWPHHPIEIKLRRLTANTQDNPVLGGVISSNGKYLAFSDKTGFYLRQVDSGETHSVGLPAGFNAVPASWYPDGTHLLATWVEGPKSPPSLWQISIMGGAPRKLIDDGRLGVVSPDGSRIAFVRGLNASEELWLMGENGQGPRRLVAGERCMFFKPAWSPDGKRIAYVVGTYAPEQWHVSTNIAIFDLDSGRQDTLFSPSSRQATISDPIRPGLVWTPDNQLRPGLAWTPDNQLIYSISELPPNQGDSNLWSIPLDSHGRVAGSALRLTATPDDVSSLSASVDGKRIAYTKNFLSPSIYITQVSAGNTRLSTPQRLTLDDWRNYPFSWTPDSRAVLFASDRDGTYHIFKQQIEQAVSELLVGGNEEAMLPRLAPDNSTLLYVIWPKLGEPVTPRRLMRVPLAGGPPQTVLQHEGMGNMQCARPPSSVCLFDSRSTTQLSFFRFDPVTGRSEELPQARIKDEVPYAYNWSLSPDGKILATARRDGMQKDPTINLYSLEDGSKRTVTAQAWAGISSIDFAADGCSLWAPAYTNTGKWALLNIDLDGRTKSVLEDTEMMIGWAIPAPDGEHLALWKARGTSNVWLLER